MKYTLFSLCLLLCYSASAKTILVGAGRTFKTITAGVKAARSGDTVLVDAGHYREKNLVITKSIVLKGINFPVLDGEKKYEVVSVKAHGFIIDGFRLIH